MSEIALPGGSSSEPTSSANGNVGATSASTSTETPNLTQSSSPGAGGEGTQDGSTALPDAFIKDLSSGPIHDYLSQNTSRADLTPRQVRDALATLDSVKELQTKHNLSIDYADKTQKKQLSAAIKQVWETLGELDSEDEPRSKADLKKDAQLAWQLNREMMARPTRSSTEKAGSKAKKKTRGTQTSTNGGSSSSKSSKKRTATDEIDSDEDPEVAGSSSKPKKKKKKSKKDGEEKEKRPSNPNNPFNRPLVLDSKMAEICGADEMPRHGVVKQLWAYIKERDLQDPANKRKILCDEKLESLFNKKVVDSFEMAKLIGSHLSRKDDLI